MTLIVIQWIWVSIVFASDAREVILVKVFWVKTYRGISKSWRIRFISQNQMAIMKSCHQQRIFLFNNRSWRGNDVVIIRENNLVRLQVIKSLCISKSEYYILHLQTDNGEVVRLCDGVITLYFRVVGCKINWQERCLKVQKHHVLFSQVCDCWIVWAKHYNGRLSNMEVR